MQRTFKIGEQVKLRDMRHLEDKFSINQHDRWVDGMTKDFNNSVTFTVVNKIKDKWYRIEDDNSLSWQVRYNWIESLEEKPEGPITTDLWNAIVHLTPTNKCPMDKEWLPDEFYSYYTCDVIEQPGLSSTEKENIFEFLKTLGFTSEMKMSMGAYFSEFKTETKRQGARFQWLHFAYWIAKEQGI